MSAIPNDGDRLAALAAAYDFDADDRDKRKLEWRADLLDEWVKQLEPHSRIIELGAGTGQAARHLQDKGFTILAIDLSAGNVAKCLARGVSAVVADMEKLTDLDDPAFAPPYDAAFAINSLIHFPKSSLDTALTSIRAVLQPGAPLLFTLWGGESSEGQWEDDWCDPPRFFSFYNEDEIDQREFPGFESTRFSTLDNRDKLGLHSLVVELTAA